MAGSAAEAKFGILIEGKNQSKQAFDQAIQSNRELNATVERLTLVSKEHTAATRQVATSTDAMKQASLGATDALSRQAGVAGGLVQSLAGLGSPLAIAAAAFIGIGAAALTAAKGVADYQEQMDIAAAATGLTTDEIAGLTVAATNVGQNFQQIRPALDFFTRRIGDAASGSEEAVKAFSALGVSIDDANGFIRPTGDILRDVQQQLVEIPDTADRSAKAFDLFGRGASRAITVLTSDLDENVRAAQASGVALDQAGKIAARHADTSFDRLHQSLKGISNSFGVIAAEAINPFTDSLSKAAEAAARFVHDPNVNDLMKMLNRFGAMAGPSAGASGALLDASDIQQSSKANFKPSTGPTLWSGLGSGAANPFAGAVDLVTAPANQLATSLTTAAVAADKFADQASQFERLNANFRGDVGAKGTPGGVSFSGGGFGPLPEPGFVQPPSFGVMPSIPGAVVPGTAATTLKQSKEQSDALLRSMVSSLSSAFGDFISSAIMGTMSLRRAMSSLVRSVLSQLIHTGVSAMFASLIPGGGIVASIAGANAAGSVAGGGRSANQVVFADGAFQFNIDAGLSDPSSVQAIVNDTLIPAISKAMRYGTARRAS